MKKAEKLFKDLLNENLGYIDLKPISQIETTPKADFENKFAEFLAEESKREKEDEAVKVDSKKVAKSVEEIEDHNFDYKDQKNLDNQIGQEVMNGVYFEAKQNPDKTIDEIKEIVSKNLAKDRQYYMKNAAFGVEGIGYEDTELEEVSGKYAASGYSDKLKKVVKESLMGESYDEFQRDDKGAKGIDKKDKGEEEAFGAGVAKGEKIEKKKMKKESLDTELAEIDKQAQIVALEAKLDKMDEVIEGKMSRINMVSEDENLSELVDKKKMKAMQKEVKILEKRKAKMEKMYEKMCGKKYQKEEIVGETSTYAINEGYDQDGSMTKGLEGTPVWEVPKDTQNPELKPYAGKYLTLIGGEGDRNGAITVNQIEVIEKDPRKGWNSSPFKSIKSTNLDQFGKVIGYYKEDKSDPDYEAKKAALKYTMKPEDREKKQKVKAAQASGDFSTLTFKNKSGQEDNLQDNPLKYILSKSK
jgi:hypothetical protein